jgi:hypothetical protein
VVLSYLLSLYLSIYLSRSIYLDLSIYVYLSIYLTFQSVSLCVQCDACLLHSCCEALMRSISRKRYHSASCSQYTFVRPLRLYLASASASKYSLSLSLSSLSLSLSLSFSLSLSLSSLLASNNVIVYGHWWPIGKMVSIYVERIMAAAFSLTMKVGTRTKVPAYIVIAKLSPFARTGGEQTSVSPGMRGNTLASTTRRLLAPLTRSSLSRTEPRAQLHDAWCLTKYT